MQVVSLSSLIEASANEGTDVEQYLRSFICKKNNSVESFLHNKAIANEMRHLGRTSIVIDEDNANEIIGYFKITTKPFDFTDASGGTRQKLTGNKKVTVFQTILIAKLGRSDRYKGIVSGGQILDLALENCNKVFDLAALRLVCVEYESHPKLMEFYSENQFTELQAHENGLIISYLRL